MPSSSKSRKADCLIHDRTDVTGSPFIDNPGPAKWFNTDAFAVPAPFTPRSNPYQYSGITGPVFWNADGTLPKNFPIREKYKLQFRFEAYNLTNSLMWANPNLTVGNAVFGRSTARATTCSTRCASRSNRRDGQSRRGRTARRDLSVWAFSLSLKLLLR